MAKDIFAKISKISLFIVMASLILSYPTASEAAWGEKKTKTEKKAEEEKKKAEEAKKVRAAAIAKKRKMIKAAKGKLNDTVWNIEVKRLGGGKDKKKAESFNDTVRFVDNQIGSETLADDGFSFTNFSVRIKEKRGPTGKDLIIWETMQTSEENGLAFWRGEYEQDDTVMRGALSRHYDKENIKNYTFSGTKAEAVEEPDPAAEEVVEAEVAPAAKEEIPAAKEEEKIEKTAEKVDKTEEKIEKTEEKVEEAVEKVEEKE